MKGSVTFPDVEVTLVIGGHLAPLDLPLKVPKKLLCMLRLPRDFQSGTQSHSRPKRWKEDFFFYLIKTAPYLKAIYQLLCSYRCQISNLHPECIVWELLHPFSSNNEALVQETSNEVNRQEREPTEKKKKNYFTYKKNKQKQTLLLTFCT